MSFWKRDTTDLPSSARPTGRRTLYVIFGVVIAVAIGVVMWPNGLPVELEVVTRGPMEVTVSEDGRTRVRDRYLVSAPVTATLLRVNRDPGDPVSVGDSLVEFVPAASPMADPTSQALAVSRVASAQAALERARASRDQATAALALAEQATTRQQILLEQTSGTPAALERAQLEERIRRQDLNSAEFGIRIAEQELSMARVTARPVSSDGRRAVAVAPVDGVVLRVLNEGGGLVQAGMPILEVGDPTALEVVVDVLTSDATRVNVGCDVVLERWGGQPLRGTVRLVEPSAFTRVSALGVEEQRVNLVIDLDDAPGAWRTLGDGYRVEARVIVWSSPSALQVPASAVFRIDDDWAVFRREGGKAVLQRIEVGEWGTRTVEVRGGLDEGDAVVLYPSDAVDEGTRISG